jgi:RNA polymerase sigma-70 factor (ECF subfamily)
MGVGQGAPVRLVEADRDVERAGAAALEHADALHRLARYLVRDPAEAEDLVQETYLRAFRGWARRAPERDLRAWLCRILRNAFLDRARAERRHPTEVEPEESAPGPADLGGADGWLRGDQELERLRGLVGEEIEAALRSLGEAARTIVLLDLEGLSEAELAVALACPAGTVKSRLFRARAALRARLAEYRR